MFDIIKIGNKDILSSLCSRRGINNITNVNCPSFSEKLMEDGVTVIPNENKIVSVCKGMISILFPKKHAFVLITNDGGDILVHISVYTVNLFGKSFECFEKFGDRVKSGETIIQFDHQYLSNKNLDMTTMVILTNNRIRIDKIDIGEDTSKSQTVLKKKGF